MPLPGWLDLRSVASFIAGALLCVPLSYCAGKRDAEMIDAERVKLAAQQVERAALKAEMSATIIDANRRATSAAEVAELQEIVNEVATDDAVGDGMQSVLDRLRGRDTARGDRAAP